MMCLQFTDVLFICIYFLLCCIHVFHNKLERLIVYVYNDVEYDWICFLSMKIGSNENENSIFSTYFFNKDTSVINQGQIMKLSLKLDIEHG